MDGMAWGKMVLTIRAATACKLFLEHATINNHYIIPLPSPIRLGLGGLSDKSGFLGNGRGGEGGGREGGVGGSGRGGGGEGGGRGGENGDGGGFEGDGAWRGESLNSAGRGEVSCSNKINIEIINHLIALFILLLIEYNNYVRDIPFN